jgi:hypothetical protein
MRKFLLICLIILSFRSTEAVLTNFADPEKTKPKIKTFKKQYKKKTLKEKNRKIKAAIIWQLPQREFLGKELTKEEENIIDSEALTRFIEAASYKNPEAYKIYRSKSKNNKLLKNITQQASRHIELDILDSYIENKNSYKEQQKEIVIKEIKEISKLYKELKKTYAKGSRNTPEQYKELKSKIAECCGLENFLYVENLLKREIHFEIFNT